MEDPIPSGQYLKAPPSPPRLLRAKAPLFSRESSEGSTFELPKRSHPVRVVSMDTGVSERKKRHKTRRKKESARAISSPEGPLVMKQLSFQNIDLGNTPLSSLRSCSEYMRNYSNQENRKKVVEDQTESFWSLSFLWGKPKYKTPKRKLRVRFNDNAEQQFLVERLRFNEANLMEGEDYNYRNTAGNVGCFNGSETSNDSYTPTRPSMRSSLLHETSIAFDYLFGIKVIRDPQPMEIELKNLKEPQLLDVYHHNQQIPNYVARVAGEEQTHRNSLTEQVNGIRRVTSFRTLERVEDGVEVVQRPRLPSEIRPVVFDIHDSTTWQPVLLAHWQLWLDSLRERRVAIVRPSDDSFYESLRLQPFSSGAYLRGMLLAGLSSTLFQIYNVFTWPHISEEIQSGLGWHQHAIQKLLYLNLFFQIFLNILQVPCRLRIHYLCWEASRAIEVDGAVGTIRNMIQEDAWLINKFLGILIDSLSLLNIIITEIYLYSTQSQDDPIRSLIVSLCATNLLTFACRVVVATAFSLSMHDPHTLSEARRRGLSKYDLEVLPTFVFTNIEEVTTCDCSICLTAFDLGEMLISLPCDKKHSFHANCIRQWLQRQNSCPLCQKLV